MFIAGMPVRPCSVRTASSGIVMRLAGKRGHFLSRIGDADGAAPWAAPPGCGRNSRRHSPAGGRARRRPAAAPAAHAGRHARPCANGSGMPKRAGLQHLAIRHAMKFQRRVLGRPRAETRCGTPAPPAAASSSAGSASSRMGVIAARRWRRRRSARSVSAVPRMRGGARSAAATCARTCASAARAACAAQVAECSASWPGQGGRNRIRRWYWILTGLQVQVGAICPRTTVPVRDSSR